MAFLVSFTDEQIAALKGVVDQELNRRTGPSRRTEQDAASRKDTEHQASDVYIVYTPSSGIPAVSGASTGTGTPVTGATPGKATCEVYRMDEQDSGDPILIDAGFELEVYNSSSTAVDGNAWVRAVKSKSGFFFAESPGASVRAGSVRAICDTNSGTGSNDIDTTKYIYKVELHDTHSEYTCTEERGYHSHDQCCDEIIDQTTGVYSGSCIGQRDPQWATGSGSGSELRSPECLDLITGGVLSATTENTPVVYIYAVDIRPRQLEIGTKVVVAQIDEGWVIVQAHGTQTKVCVMTDIACATDCDGNQVFLRSYTPIWVDKVCAEETEFIPECPGTGSGSGSASA